MTAEVRRLDIREFRARGYLHEINRLLLHPLGLALEVEIDPQTGEERLGGVWDCQNDPEGVIYVPDRLDPAKAARVAEEIEAKGLDRARALGYVIQPLPPDARQLTLRVLEPAAVRLPPVGAIDEGEETPGIAPTTGGEA